MSKEAKSSPADKGFNVNRGNPVSRIKVTTGCDYYRVDLRHDVSGKSVRKSFSSPQKAVAYASRCMGRLRGGKSASSHPADLQREAMKILNPFKASLYEAALFYARYHGARDRAESVGVLASRYLEEKKKQVENGKLTPASLADNRHFLKRFAEEFGPRAVDLVAPGELDFFLDDINGTANRRSHRLYISAFFNWVVSCGHLDVNPVRKTRRIRKRHQIPAIYSPSEVQRMMDAAEPDLLPYLALRMFTGARTGEILRLKWKDVDFERAEVKLHTGSSGRRSKPRSVALPQNLAQYLLPYRSKPEAAVVPHELRSLQRWMKKLLLELDIQPIYEGARHTFTACHLALHPLADTMHALGCSTTAVLLKYCGSPHAVSRREAEQYFAIAPAAQGEIIPMTREAAA